MVYRSSETVPLKSNNNGTYIANWIPSVSGNYTIQIFIDGCSAGMIIYTTTYMHALKCVVIMLR